MKHNSNSGVNQEPNSSERLDGWKEIAAYLMRDVRTVQRWEKNEDLPILRHAHDTRATVYAYPSEIDAWWNNRHERLEAIENFKRTRSRLRARFSAGLVIGVVAILFVVWWGLDSTIDVSGTLGFQERDWVLITQFENRTREPLLDGTPEYVLQRELVESPFVNVVPRPRIEDTLRLMEKPVDTPVDLTLGREICLRDGAIRALLAGRVVKLDSTYVLTVQLVNPVNGQSVAYTTEEAMGEAALLPAMKRLSIWVREMLGEKLPQIPDSELELAKATTSSLKALQLFSEADALQRRGQNGIAGEFLKSAIAEDPGFAAAYTWLGMALKNQNRGREEYLPHLKQGFDLSDRVSEWERYHIRGVYHAVCGELEEAIPIFEALVRRYPDDCWGYSWLEGLYSGTGQAEKVVPLIVRRAELRPNHGGYNFHAAHALIYHQGDLAQAQEFVEKAHRSMSPESRPPHHTAWIPFLDLFPFFQHWIAGDVESALEELTRAESGILQLDAKTADNYRLSVGSAYLSLGMLERAREVFRGLTGVLSEEHGQSQPEFEAQIRARHIASTAFLGDDEELFRAVLAEELRNEFIPEPLTIMFMARFGMISQANRGFVSLEREVEASGPLLELARTEIALAGGGTAGAVESYRRYLALMKMCGPVYFLASESLALALEQQGDTEGALRVLESASQQRVKGYLAGAAYWMRNEWQRARLCRELGRDGEADQIEAELRRLLATADPDHPILELVSQRRDMAHAASHPQNY